MFYFDKKFGARIKVLEWEKKGGKSTFTASAFFPSGDSGRPDIPKKKNLMKKSGGKEDQLKN